MPYSLNPQSRDSVKLPVLWVGNGQRKLQEGLLWGFFSKILMFGQALKPCFRSRRQGDGLLSERGEVGNSGEQTALRVTALLSSIPTSGVSDSPIAHD